MDDPTEEQGAEAKKSLSGRYDGWRKGVEAKFEEVEAKLTEAGESKRRELDARKQSKQRSKEQLQGSPSRATKGLRRSADRYVGERQGVLAPKGRKEELKAPHLQARQAFEDGDRLVQFVLPVIETRRGWSRISGWPDDVARSQSRHANAIAAIEAEGWRLEQASYVFEQTGFLSRDQFWKSGQAARVTGNVLGVYIFRRDETAREPND